jgi:hypothetical protein
MKISNIVIFILSNFCWINVFAQFKNIQLNAFGHLEYTLEHEHQKINSFFSLGEHDVFVQAKITKRISFLSEVTIKYDHASSSKFAIGLERALLKFNLNSKHSVIVGKIHTPVNYWNDVYHHGRVFFPVIDRPLAFNYFVPIHTTGLQLQGQNIGKFKFGYDIVVGNSINSTDVFEEGFTPAIAAAFHFKPIVGMRIGASYYYDYMEENGYGAHSGHQTNTHSNHNLYTDELYYHTTCFSLALFQDKYEILNEFTLNVTITDTLGTAINYSNFIYLGYIIKEKHVPFVVFDFVRIASNDLHSLPLERIKIGLGYKHIFSYLINLKVQFEYYSSFNTFINPVHHMNKLELQVQLAYGF